MPDDKITEIELVYHNKKKAADQPKIISSRDAYDLFRPSWNEGQINLREHFKVMLLSRSNRCLGISTISEGGISGCYVDPKLIFALAVKAKASAIMLAHNHPSGEMNFSHTDMYLTRVLVNAGALFEIAVMDHLLITQDGYKSMSDTGYMPIASNKSEHILAADQPQPKEKHMTDASKKPNLYIFNQNSQGEAPVGAVFMHQKGNGFSLVIAEKWYSAFPPKPKPEQEATPAAETQPKKRQTRQKPQSPA